LCPCDEEVSTRLCALTRSSQGTYILVAVHAEGLDLLNHSLVLVAVLFSGSIGSDLGNLLTDGLEEILRRDGGRLRILWWRHVALLTFFFVSCETSFRITCRGSCSAFSCAISSYLSEIQNFRGATQPSSGGVLWNAPAGKSTSSERFWRYPVCGGGFGKLRHGMNVLRNSLL